MSHENQSFLRFSLEESVWFQRGQEVAELVSISLDPNISIVENDQYVAIRGSLELTGEYVRTLEDEIDKEEEISAPKFIQSVEEREEGICEFTHRFPVDITIPNNRIQNINDIGVTVDSFDYAVPERSCLRLAAELTISGLYGEQQNVPIEDEDREPEAEPFFNEEANEDQTDLYEEIKLEIDQDEETPEPQLLHRAGQTEELEETKGYNPNFILSYPTETVSDELEEDESGLYEISQPFTAEAKKQPNSDTAPSDYSWGIPIQSNQAPITKGPDFSFASQRKDPNVSKAEVEYPQESSYEQPSAESKDTVVVIEVELDESSSSSSSEQIQVKKKKSSKKKSMSIAEFLGRKTENELQAKLKVCIVQHGETLDSLAERYDIGVQQILRVNHLEATQDVYEGQVLYIPETANSR